MVLPNPAKVAPEATIPDAPPDHEWIYPYSIGPHYHSQNAGPWCVLVFPAACMQSPSGMYHIAERQSFAYSHLAFLKRRRSLNCAREERRGLFAAALLAARRDRACKGQWWHETCC